MTLIDREKLQTEVRALLGSGFNPDVEHGVAVALHYIDNAPAAPEETMTAPDLQCRNPDHWERAQAVEEALREIIEAVGDRTFVLSESEDGLRRAIVFGKGESVDAVSGRQLGPGQFAVNGSQPQDPLVAAFARAMEIVGPGRLSLGTAEDARALGLRAALEGSTPE